MEAGQRKEAEEGEALAQTPRCTTPSPNGYPTWRLVLREVLIPYRTYYRRSLGGWVTCDGRTA
jgi:hypothetical protein